MTSRTLNRDWLTEQGILGSVALKQQAVSPLVVEGMVQQEEGVVNLLAQRVAALPLIT